MGPPGHTPDSCPPGWDLPHCHKRPNLLLGREAVPPRTKTWCQRETFQKSSRTSFFECFCSNCGLYMFSLYQSYEYISSKMFKDVQSYIYIYTVAKCGKQLRTQYVGDSLLTSPRAVIFRHTHASSGALRCTSALYHDSRFHRVVLCREVHPAEIPAKRVSNMRGRFPFTFPCKRRLIICGWSADRVEAQRQAVRCSANLGIRVSKGLSHLKGSETASQIKSK